MRFPCCYGATSLASLSLVKTKIHSANQLSIYGAVSSWCDELAEEMPGQTSLGVDKSSSKVDDQLTKHLDPQEVGSVVQNQTRTEEAAGNCWRDHIQRFKMLDPDKQVRAINESAGFIRPVSVGMYHRTGDDVNNGFGKLTASCREYTQPRAHQDSVVKVWIQKYQGMGQVLKSRLSVVFANMESKFRSLLHLEITPMFVWSYPEAQNATWMSYDTTIQNILQEALKKPDVKTCKKLMQNSQPFNRDLNAVHLTTGLCDFESFLWSWVLPLRLPLESGEDPLCNPPSHPKCQMHLFAVAKALNRCFVGTLSPCGRPKNQTVFAPKRVVKSTTFPNT